jgi:hypothetical protein
MSRRLHALNFYRYGVLAESRQSSHELLFPCSVCWQIRWHLVSERSCRLEKPLVVRRLKFAPEVGFEPTTNRLTADRSTTELLWIVTSVDRRAVYFAHVGCHGK